LLIFDLYGLCFVFSSEHIITYPGEYATACSAKINWFLNVSARRPDGYHELQTVMQRIDLFDRLSLRTRDDGNIECIDAAQACGCEPGDNILYRAAMLLKEHYEVPYGISITVEKNIPVGAGLGGGSSDAAAVLCALASLWSLSVLPGELSILAAELGADVPFFLGPPAAFCTGIGETISRITPREFNLVLWKPAASLVTQQVYQQFDHRQRPEMSPDGFLDAYTGGDLTIVSRHIWNNLALAACECMPELNDMMDHCRKAGAAAVWITGSGPTVVSLCTDRAAAGQVYSEISATAAPEDFVHCAKTLTE
jgi:4-diphosphocytidyl-2-C-methyl-D-erythritol kinase